MLAVRVAVSVTMRPPSTSAERMAALMSTSFRLKPDVLAGLGTLSPLSPGRRRGPRMPHPERKSKGEMR